MSLSGKVPGRIATALRGELERAGAGGLLRGQAPQRDRSVGGACRRAHRAGRGGARAAAAPGALDWSRGVLRDFGNMSSATIMFILDRMIRGTTGPRTGMAMAFGPGLCAETFRFHRA